jgi:hypothetical protein
VAFVLAFHVEPEKSTSCVAGGGGGLGKETTAGWRRAAFRDRWICVDALLSARHRSDRGISPLPDRGSLGVAEVEELGLGSDENKEEEGSGSARLPS